MRWVFSVASAHAAFKFSQNAAFPLAIDVAHDSNADSVGVDYQRASGKGDALRIESTAASFSLLRLAPDTKYTLKPWTKSGGKLAYDTTASFTTAKTGIADLDKVQLMTFDGTPTFDVVVFDRFPGLVGVDSLGEVVWFNDKLGAESVTVSMVTPWDWTADHHVVGLQKQDSSEHPAPFDLKYMDQFGKVQTLVTATGLSHEAHFAKDGSVLSIGADRQQIEGLSNMQMGSKLMRWASTTATDVETVVDLFDVFDPAKDRGACSDDGSICEPPHSGANPKPSGDDWTHANAAMEGPDDNYIMSIRHLSMVASFSKKGELQWTMSGEGVRSSKFPDVPSFTYDKDTSKHYNNHCVRQLDNGNIMLFDNGDARPEAEGGKFSRLAEYKLDTDTHVATLVFEYKIPDEYSFHAGSMHRQANGNTVGGWSCDNTQAGGGTDECSHMIYEVDAKGAVVAHGKVPSLGTFGYRAVPTTSLGGEARLKTQQVVYV